MTNIGSKTWQSSRDVKDEISAFAERGTPGRTAWIDCAACAGLGGQDARPWSAPDKEGQPVAFLDMKAHIGVEADSGLVAHIAIATAANVNDVSQGHDLLHGEEAVCSLTHTLPGCSKATEATWGGWHVSMRPGASAARWINRPRLAPCWARPNSSGPACGPRWSIRFGWSSASRMHQGQIPWLGQEYGAIHPAVCVGQFVDGAKTDYSGSAGLNARAVGTGDQRRKKGRPRGAK